MKNKKKALLLYEYDAFNNDFTQVFEYYDYKDLLQDNPQLHTTIKTLQNSTTNSLDNIKHLINDKFLIIRETIEEEGAR